MLAKTMELIKKRVTRIAVVLVRKRLLVSGVPIRSVFSPPRLSLPVFCSNTAKIIKTEIEHCKINRKVNILINSKFNSLQTTREVDIYQYNQSLAITAKVQGMFSS